MLPASESGSRRNTDKNVVINTFDIPVTNGDININILYTLYVTVQDLAESGNGSAIFPRSAMV